MVDDIVSFKWNSRPIKNSKELLKRVDDVSRYIIKYLKLTQKNNPGMYIKYKYTVTGVGIELIILVHEKTIEEMVRNPENTKGFKHLYYDHLSCNKEQLIKFRRLLDIALEEYVRWKIER